MMQHSRTKVIQFERIDIGLTETPQGKKSDHFKSPACKTDQFFGTKVMSRNEWQQEFLKHISDYRADGKVGHLKNKFGAKYLQRYGESNRSFRQHSADFNPFSRTSETSGKFGNKQETRFMVRKN